MVTDHLLSKLEEMSFEITAVTARQPHISSNLVLFLCPTQEMEADILVSILKLTSGTTKCQSMKCSIYRVADC